MRTMVNLREEDAVQLNKLADAGTMSCDQLVRQAVAEYLEAHEAEKAETGSVREFLGIWPDFPEDGLTYQDRVRREWDR